MAREGSAEDGASTMSRRVELLATVLLALATLVTAWSAFQSAKWSGVQAISFSAANAARTESSRASTEAGLQQTMDVTAFTSWVDAVASAERTGNDSGLTDDGGWEPVAGSQPAFLADRFRPEFVPAFEAWLDTAPFAAGSGVGTTPFAMADYQLAATQTADTLLVEAGQQSNKAIESNANSDRYVLMSIVFAIVLLFAGTSTKLGHQVARRGLLGAAVVVFVVATVVVLTFPKQF
ncbi:hypothetical protein ACNHYB_02200 [Isoptericola jiangsuensis]|uniref:hypothetical protein n=1 Tax=Isoptericola jiangsuensis TaxID=548579 RepID=UPI003AACADBF